VADPEQFGGIFDRHVDAIHGFFLRRMGAAVAEELTAETFARAFARRSSFEALHDGAGPWLYGIAANLVHNARRGERRQLVAYGRAASMFREGSTDFDEADARVDAGQLRAQLVKALLGLKVSDRDALLLFAWEELSYAEIACALGIPPGTVASRINRARRLIRLSMGASERSDDVEGSV
jgi:RNA polymerase sigma-70 factor (ECF subfamily)